MPVVRRPSHRCDQGSNLRTTISLCLGAAVVRPGHDSGSHHPTTSRGAGDPVALPERSPKWVTNVPSLCRWADEE